jgi:DNA replication and repair protein RecF
MRVAKLLLHNFRNLNDFKFDPADGFNIIYGDNAQGKTNLIEAIYLLATLKSFRTSRNRELVSWDEDLAVVETLVVRRGVERHYKVTLERNAGGSRVAEVDGKRIRKLSEYFGGFNVLLFTPDEMGVSKGEPGQRRRYLDRAVFNVQPGYMDVLRAYEEALRSRNALLRDAQGQGATRSIRAVLSAFDGPLARLAAAVTIHRISYLNDIFAYFKESHEIIAGRQYDLSLRYRSSLLRGDHLIDGTQRTDFDETLEERARQRFDETLSSDVTRGFTGAGPHTDDFVSAIDGYGLRRYGSQGQHRTLLLSLKLAELAYIEKEHGFVPILLLDDVSSELDRDRGARFLERVQQAGGQVFLTTTDPSFAASAPHATLWKIERGTLCEVSHEH